MREDVIQTDQVFFTAAPGATVELPPPFLAAGRSVLLTPEVQPKVLILGYGLGAMAAIMLDRRPRASIVGVEISRQLYREAISRTPGNGVLGRALARAGRRLGRGPAPGQVQLVRTDARSFLARTRRKFDLILDDCFLLRSEDVVRDPATCASAEQLAARLTPAGVAIRNVLIGEREPLEPQIADLRESFRHVQLRRFRHWDNVLVIANQATRLRTQEI